MVWVWYLALNHSWYPGSCGILISQSWGTVSRLAQEGSPPLSHVGYSKDVRVFYQKKHRVDFGEEKTTPVLYCDVFEFCRWGNYKQDIVYNGYVVKALNEDLGELDLSPPPPHYCCQAPWSNPWVPYLPYLLTRWHDGLSKMLLWDNRMLIMTWSRS